MGLDITHNTEFLGITKHHKHCLLYYLLEAMQGFH